MVTNKNGVTSASTGDNKGFFPSTKGFMAWFILQHFRGFRPFITKIVFNESFAGNLKDENT